MMQLTSYEQIEPFLLTFIPKTLEKKYLGRYGFEKSEYFLSLLGNPQNHIPCIHTAGTSGKGSTCYLIAKLLTGLGFKTGLTLSPHILDIRERVQLNNQFISKEKFLQYLNELIPAIEKMEQSPYGTPSYFEICIALAFYTFYKEKVDYAVIETGLGGLYDTTNAIHHPLISVITKIGLDHMNILGSTIQEIAQQKAGIIKRNIPVISYDQHQYAKKVITHKAQEVYAPLQFIKEGREFSNIKSSESETIFDYRFKNIELTHIAVSLPGTYQAENSAMAISTIYLASQLDRFVFDEKKIRKTLLNTYLPARFDIQHLEGKTCVIDGAHNPQKMRELAKALSDVFPGKKFNFLISPKERKDYQGMLSYIIPLADHIIISDFLLHQDTVHASQKAYRIEHFLHKLNFFKVLYIHSQKEALEKLLSFPNKYCVITSSLYFSSDIYKLLPRHAFAKDRNNG